MVKVNNFTNINKTNNCRLKSLNTKNIKIAYVDENPGHNLGKAQQCIGVKQPIQNKHCIWQFCFFCCIKKKWIHVENLININCTMLQINWICSLGRDLSTNQKQELLIVAMFFPRSIFNKEFQWKDLIL